MCISIMEQARELREDLGLYLCIIDESLQERTGELFQALMVAGASMLGRLNVEAEALSAKYFLLLSGPRTPEVKRVLGCRPDSINELILLLFDINHILRGFPIPEKFGMDRIEVLLKLSRISNSLGWLQHYFKDFSQPELFHELLLVGESMAEFEPHNSERPLITEIESILVKIAEYQSKKEELFRRRAKATREFVKAVAVYKKEFPPIRPHQVLIPR